MPLPYAPAACPPPALKHIAALHLPRVAAMYQANRWAGPCPTPRPKPLPAAVGAHSNGIAEPTLGYRWAGLMPSTQA